MNYFIYTSHHFTPHGRYELNKLTSLPMCVFIAQLVEHRTDIAKVTGSNAVEIYELIISYILHKYHKYSCSSAISTLAGKENKRRLQTLSMDNAWSNKNFLVYLTFRMPQHTSSEVNGYNCYKHLKILK